jgi:hypothetical protein
MTTVTKVTSASELEGSIFSCMADVRAAKVLQLTSPDIQKALRSARANRRRTGNSRAERR